MEYERIARQLLIALRGRRSQVQWSRRLGYRSNVAYAWESGRRWPTAAETFRAAARSGVDVTAAITRFQGSAWDGDLSDPAVVAAMLDDLRGQSTVAEVARRCGVSRFRLTRWLAGQTQPRLPDLLRVVEAASLRLVDLVACLVDPEQVPEIVEEWRRLEVRRRGAALHPWTPAVLRALDLAAYQALPGHVRGWVADAIGVPVEIEDTCLGFLAETGQVGFTGTHYRPSARAVDTRMAPDAGRDLKVHWTGVAADQLRAGAPGQFSYNVFAVSRADLERIRELHLGYFRALRAIVSASAPTEVVAVANVQLFPLGGGGATPGGTPSS